MKIFDRLILALFSLSIAILSLVIIIIPFDVFSIFNIRHSINMVQSMKGNYLYSLIGLMFFAISIRFLFSGIVGTKDKEDKSFLILKNEYGEIIIYSHTIIGLVQNIVNGFTGITNIKTNVNLVEGKIEILMKGDILPEINIPEITKGLQMEVKESIQNTTGAKVGDIKVEINNVNVSAPDRIVK